MATRIKSSVEKNDQLSFTETLQQRKRFDQNYGAMTMIMGFLPRFEQLKLQSLDKWWYMTGVARVQCRFMSPEMFFLTDG